MKGQLQVLWVSFYDRNVISEQRSIMGCWLHDIDHRNRIGEDVFVTNKFNCYPIYTVKFPYICFQHLLFIFRFLTLHLFLELPQPPPLQTLSYMESTETVAEDWVKFYRDGYASERANYLERLGIVKEEEPKSPMPIENHFESGDYSLNFYLTKTHDDYRRSYLDKLIDTGVLKLEPSKKYQCILIFDWDDTIMSTSFISRFDSLKSITPEAKAQLDNLDVCAAKLIAKAATYGDMFIITNAAKGWVEYSSKNYLPLTGAALDKSKTVVISARTTYQTDFPGDFYRWKVEAFKSIKKKFQTNLVTNLICIGDSNIEMDAAHTLGKEFAQSLVKTIKFREGPKPQQLVKQQELVTERLQQIFSNSKNLTIKLQKKQKQTSKGDDRKSGASRGSQTAESDNKSPDSPKSPTGVPKTQTRPQ